MRAKILGALPPLKTKILSLKWLIAGVFIGLTTLAKPVFPIFVPFLFIWLFFVYKDKLTLLRNCLFILIGIVFTIAPWTIRNYMYYGGFLLISTGAHDFWMTNNDVAMQLEILPEMDIKAPEKWNWFPKDRQEEISKLPTLEAERVFLKESYQWVRNNPKKFGWLLWRRILHFWRLWPVMAEKREKIIAKFTSGIYLPIAWIVWRCR